MVKKLELSAACEDIKMIFLTYTSTYRIFSLPKTTIFSSEN